MKSTGLNPMQTFNAFLCGAGNSFACSAARDVAAGVLGSCHPLLIYGGVGVGKTHLLHAVGNERIRINPLALILNFSSEQFMNEMIQALRGNKMDRFRNSIRTVDLLLVDDIQFMAGKEATQEEFFNSIEALQRAGRQVVATCRTMRDRGAVIDEALLSRLCGGVIVRIEAPDQETRLLFLRKKAIEHGLDLSEEVALHFATVTTGDLRRVEGNLVTLKAFAAGSQLEITVDLLRSLLRLE
ncbi:Chromosomal replication initiator protein DnaA [Citrifermentans bremense]|uniref:Chromosomal replication initiator protein DnaA n=2 Tax=Citrifermentans bremense TaxID=60035 RepID=A0A6S6M2X7_9BACT|nr:Chromosomal replication initiator protein DnaA [Citrifermentans bremense]